MGNRRKRKPKTNCKRLITLIKIILILSLLSILYQDIKERNVYWFLFLIVSSCAGYLYFTRTFFELFWRTSVMNLTVIGIIFLVLAGYSKFKLKVNLKDVFGLGDAFLFIGLCVAFPVATFITFFVFSLLFSMLLHFLFKQKQQEYYHHVMALNR